MPRKLSFGEAQFGASPIGQFHLQHQTIILSIGYLVVQWAALDLLKFMIIALSSFLTILTIYEFLIRRNNVMRFLFGVKMRVLSDIARPTEPATRSISASFGK